MPNLVLAAAALSLMCAGCGGGDEPEFDKADFNALMVERQTMNQGYAIWTPTTIGDLMPGSRTAAAAMDDGPITDTVVVGHPKTVTREYGVITTTSDRLVDFNDRRAQGAYLKVELDDVRTLCGTDPGESVEFWYFVADKDKWEIVRDGLTDMEQIVVFLIDREQPAGFHLTLGLNWISEVDSDGFAAFPGIEEGMALHGGAKLDQIDEACPNG